MLRKLFWAQTESRIPVSDLEKQNKCHATPPRKTGSLSCRGQLLREDRSEKEEVTQFRYPT